MVVKVRLNEIQDKSQGAEQHNPQGPGIRFGFHVAFIHCLEAGA